LILYSWRSKGTSGLPQSCLFANPVVRQAGGRAVKNPAEAAYCRAVMQENMAQVPVNLISSFQERRFDSCFFAGITLVWSVGRGMGTNPVMDTYQHIFALLTCHFS
jgi:hypothetical protein